MGVFARAGQGPQKPVVFPDALRAGGRADDEVDVVGSLAVHGESSQVLAGVVVPPAERDQVPAVVRSPRRTEPDVIALRIQLCAELHHSYARVLVDIGEIEKAKEQIREAVEMWLPIRLEIIQDALLKPLWDSMATEWP